ncbi:MAG: hypothetical protein Q9160_006949 [Pyrenula sp. 1 TL-2023]
MDSRLSTAKSPTASAIPILSFLAILLSVPPLTAHIKGRNLAASALIVWVTLFNLFNFINALIWPTDDIPSWWSGAGLCDIEVKLIDAAAVGAPGAVACIFRQLAIILDTERTVLTPSRGQRRKKLVFEVFFCFVLPAWMCVAQYIVQTKRYYVFGIAGCAPSYDNSWLGIVLVLGWPFVLCVFDAFYCRFFGFGRDAVGLYRGWIRGVGLGGVLDKYDGWRRERRGSAGEKSSRWGSTVSATSSMGQRWGSVSSRAKLLFHHKDNNAKVDNEIEKRGSETEHSLPPLPLPISLRHHHTVAFGANIAEHPDPHTLPPPPPAAPVLANSDALAPAPPPPAYRWSWRMSQGHREGRGSRSPPSASEEDLKSGTRSGSADGRASDSSAENGRERGTVETRIWSEKPEKVKRKISGVGIEVGARGMQPGEVRVVREVQVVQTR